ncbi:SKA complex subunit 1-like [Clavelina lepadiformis]|uniref:SKA complex subunit 1-like n=1 Tax=Clavelina lepadiformis TaxID=159417 RepID=UPI004041ABD5
MASNFMLPATSQNLTTTNDTLECLVLKFERLMQQVEDGLEIRDVLHHKDGRSIYCDLHKKTVCLKGLLSEMQCLLDKQKEELRSFKVNLDDIHALQKKIDRLMIFAMKNFSPLNISNSNPTSPNLSHETDADKENAPVPVKQKPQTKPHKAVPSLNHLTEQQLQTVPKYVKGHLSLVLVNAGIDEINKVLSKKYEFLNRPRKTLSLKEEKRRAVYLEQAKEVKGTPYSTFFVDDDIYKFTTTLKTKKKTKNDVFLILRHLGRVKEMHKGNLTRYCILSV